MALGLRRLLVPVASTRLLPCLQEDFSARGGPRGVAAAGRLFGAIEIGGWILQAFAQSSTAVPSCLDLCFDPSIEVAFATP